MRDGMEYPPSSWVDFVCRSPVDDYGRRVRHLVLAAGVTWRDGPLPPWSGSGRASGRRHVRLPSTIPVVTAASAMFATTTSSVGGAYCPRQAIPPSGQHGGRPSTLCLPPPLPESVSIGVEKIGRAHV